MKKQNELAQAAHDLECGLITLSEFNAIKRSALKRIPQMPRGVRLLRYWPVSGPIRILGYAHTITDVHGFIVTTLARLDRALRRDQREVFSVEALVDRLQKLGCLVEVDPEPKKIRREKTK